MILIQKQKYKNGSKDDGLSDFSGSKLAQFLGINVYTPRIKPNLRKLKGWVINWGLSSIPWLDEQRFAILNKPSSIPNASNKLTAFEMMREARVVIPGFTTDIEEAKGWFDTPSTIVFCRTTLYGSCGSGIVIARNKEQLVTAKLYVYYIKKKWEYRVHVFKDGVFHVQQKRRLTSEQLAERGIDNRDRLIRNLDNGYIFSTNIDPLLPISSAHMCVKAVQSLGLDFGAVDLIVTEAGEVVVLEVNTAPGLEGSTLTRYKEVFEQFGEENGSTSIL